MNTMNKSPRILGTPGRKKRVRQPALLTRNSRTEPLWNNRTIRLAALATVAVIGLVSMTEMSSSTRRRMPPSTDSDSTTRYDIHLSVYGSNVLTFKPCYGYHPFKLIEKVDPEALDLNNGGNYFWKSTLPDQKHMIMKAMKFKLRQESGNKEEVHVYLTSPYLSNITDSPTRHHLGHCRYTPSYPSTEIERIMKAIKNVKQDEICRHNFNVLQPTSQTTTKKVSPELADDNITRARGVAFANPSPPRAPQDNGIANPIVKSRPRSGRAARVQPPQVIKNLVCDAFPKGRQIKHIIRDIKIGTIIVDSNGKKYSGSKNRHPGATGRVVGLSGNKANVAWIDVKHPYTDWTSCWVTKYINNPVTVQVMI